MITNELELRLGDLFNPQDLEKFKRSEGYQIVKLASSDGRAWSITFNAAGGYDICQDTRPPSQILLVKS